MDFEGFFLDFSVTDGFVNSPHIQIHCQAPCQLLMVTPVENLIFDTLNLRWSKPWLLNMELPSLPLAVQRFLCLRYSCKLRWWNGIGSDNLSLDTNMLYNTTSSSLCFAVKCFP